MWFASLAIARFHHIVFMSTTYFLSQDKEVYDTVIRVSAAYNKLGKAYEEIFRHFGWRKTVLWTDDYW